MWMNAWPFLLASTVTLRFRRRHSNDECVASLQQGSVFLPLLLVALTVCAGRELCIVHIYGIAYSSAGLLGNVSVSFGCHRCGWFCSCNFGVCVHVSCTKTLHLRFHWLFHVLAIGAPMFSVLKVFSRLYCEYRVESLNADTRSVSPHGQEMETVEADNAPMLDSVESE